MISGVDEMMSKYLKKRKPNFREHLNLFFYFNLDALKNYIFHSAIMSFIYTIIMFIISVLFNGEYIYLPKLDDNLFLGILSIFFKALLITCFYFLLLCAYGNARELNGNTINGKDLLFLVIISLIHAYKDPLTMVIALSFIVNILILISKKQEKEERMLKINLDDLKNKEKLMNKQIISKKDSDH